MKTIQTAEEFIKGKEFSISSIQNMMIEFAKLHVTAALKQASESAEINGYALQFVSEDSIMKHTILEAYPLDNIK